MNYLTIINLLVVFYGLQLWKSTLIGHQLFLVVSSTDSVLTVQYANLRDELHTVYMRNISPFTFNDRFHATSYCGIYRHA